MKHDIFELNPVAMTRSDRTWRALLLIGLIAVLCMDLFVWRPL